MWPLQSQVLDKSFYMQQELIWYNSLHVIRTHFSAFLSYRAATVAALVLDSCPAVSADCSWVLEPAMPRSWGVSGRCCCLAVCCCTDWPHWEMGTDLNGLRADTAPLLCVLFINELIVISSVYTRHPFPAWKCKSQSYWLFTVFRYFQISCKFCQGSEFPTLTVFIPSTEILFIPDGNTSGCALNIHQHLRWWVLCQG